ncbi:S-adenosyl-L-methionine-dependent tRNA 4-demethylwyosine synthase TYW1 [Geodia barretti]|uniref:S-adenosyl-L-methionine-dependent tRNA 4-demethylwyosine synthase TYW1 n=1 Tax=Geodia barretti TaxID=519541 RepID=A0AA35RYY7_GEOBA|nr:S-adenosyl-L-methionine-dependent tRNA 4-demethylwyosine synthase TYW1 [Geodia barretti]
MHYAVFGLGNSLYTQHYNTAGRELYRHLQQLSAQPVHQLGLGDQNVAQSKYGGIEEDFVAWWKELKARLLPVLNGSSPISSLDGPQPHQPTQDSIKPGSNAVDAMPEVLWESSSEEEGEEEEGGGEGGKRESGVVDLEDVGDMLRKARPPRASRELKIKRRGERREMVTPLLRKTLSKQGVYSNI